MPVTWDLPTKNKRMIATKDHYASGWLDLMSASNVVLASFQFTAGAGSVTDDVWTLGLASLTVTGLPAAGAGTVATKARLRTAGGVAGGTGMTVGLSNADIIMTNTNVASGQNVVITNTPVLRHGL